MSERKSLLDRIVHSFQCPMDWREMDGDERSRFCARCQKKVHNLSERTADEAEEFVRNNPSACVAFVRRVDGSVVTRGCPREKARKTALSAAVAAGAAALASCGHAEEPTEEIPLPGMFLCPEETK